MEIDEEFNKLIVDMLCKLRSNRGNVQETIEQLISEPKVRLTTEKRFRSFEFDQRRTCESFSDFDAAPQACPSYDYDQRHYPRDSYYRSEPSNHNQYSDVRDYGSSPSRGSRRGNGRYKYSGPPRRYRPARPHRYIKTPPRVSDSVGPRTPPGSPPADECNRIDTIETESISEDSCRNADDEDHLSDERLFRNVSPPPLLQPDESANRIERNFDDANNNESENRCLELSKLDKYETVTSDKRDDSNVTSNKIPITTDDGRINEIFITTVAEKLNEKLEDSASNGASVTQVPSTPPIMPAASPKMPSFPPAKDIEKENAYKFKDKVPLIVSPKPYQIPLLIAATVATTTSNSASSVTKYPVTKDTYGENLFKNLETNKSYLPKQYTIPKKSKTSDQSASAIASPSSSPLIDAANASPNSRVSGTLEANSSNAKVTLPKKPAIRARSISMYVNRPLPSPSSSTDTNFSTTSSSSRKLSTTENQNLNFDPFAKNRTRSLPKTYAKRPIEESESNRCFSSVNRSKISNKSVPKTAAATPAVTNVVKTDSDVNNKDKLTLEQYQARQLSNATEKKPAARKARSKSLHCKEWKDPEDMHKEATVSTVDEVVKTAQKTLEQEKTIVPKRRQRSKSVCSSKGCESPYVNDLNFYYKRVTRSKSQSVPLMDGICFNNFDRIARSRNDFVYLTNSVSSSAIKDPSNNSYKRFFEEDDEDLLAAKFEKNSTKEKVAKSTSDGTQKRRGRPKSRNSTVEPAVPEKIARNNNDDEEKQVPSKDVVASPFTSSNAESANPAPFKSTPNAENIKPKAIFARRYSTVESKDPRLNRSASTEVRDKISFEEYKKSVQIGIINPDHKIRDFVTPLATKATNTNTKETTKGDSGLVIKMNKKIATIVDNATNTVASTAGDKLCNKNKSKTEDKEGSNDYTAAVSNAGNVKASTPSKITERKRKHSVDEEKKRNNKHSHHKIRKTGDRKTVPESVKSKTNSAKEASPSVDGTNETPNKEPPKEKAKPRTVTWDHNLRNVNDSKFNKNSISIKTQTQSQKTNSVANAAEKDKPKNNDTTKTVTTATVTAKTTKQFAKDVSNVAKEKDPVSNSPAASNNNVEVPPVVNYEELDANVSKILESALAEVDDIFPSSEASIKDENILEIHSEDGSSTKLQIPKSSCPSPVREATPKCVDVIDLTEEEYIKVPKSECQEEEIVEPEYPAPPETPCTSLIRVLEDRPAPYTNNNNNKPIEQKSVIVMPSAIKKDASVLRSPLNSSESANAERQRVSPLSPYEKVALLHEEGTTTKDLPPPQQMANNVQREIVYPPETPAATTPETMSSTLNSCTQTTSRSSSVASNVPNNNNMISRLENVLPTLPSPPTQQQPTLTGKETLHRMLAARSFLQTSNVQTQQQSSASPPTPRQSPVNRQSFISNSPAVSSPVRISNGNGHERNTILQASNSPAESASLSQCQNLGAPPQLIMRPFVPNAIHIDPWPYISIEECAEYIKNYLSQRYFDSVICKQYQTVNMRWMNSEQARIESDKYIHQFEIMNDGRVYHLLEQFKNRYLRENVDPTHILTYLEESIAKRFRETPELAHLARNIDRKLLVILLRNTDPGPLSIRPNAFQCIIFVMRMEMALNDFQRYLSLPAYQDTVLDLEDALSKLHKMLNFAMRPNYQIFKQQYYVEALKQIQKMLTNRLHAAANRAALAQQMQINEIQHLQLREQIKSYNSLIHSMNINVTSPSLVQVPAPQLTQNYSYGGGAGAGPQNKTGPVFNNVPMMQMEPSSARSSASSIAAPSRSSPMVVDGNVAASETQNNTANKRSSIIKIEPLDYKKIIEIIDVDDENDYVKMVNDDGIKEECSDDKEMQQRTNNSVQEEEAQRNVNTPRSSSRDSGVFSPADNSLQQNEHCICGNELSFVCSGCMSRTYCSVQCQLRDWVQHSVFCEQRTGK